MVVKISVIIFFVFVFNCLGFKSFLKMFCFCWFLKVVFVNFEFYGDIEIGVVFLVIEIVFFGWI